jgi:hypothetical protein
MLFPQLLRRSRSFDPDGLGEGEWSQRIFTRLFARLLSFARLKRTCIRSYRHNADTCSALYVYLIALHDDLQLCELLSEAVIL